MTASDIRALVAAIGVLVLAGMQVISPDALLTFLGGLALASPLSQRP